MQGHRTNIPIKHQPSDVWQESDISAVNLAAVLVSAEGFLLSDTH